MPQLRMMLEGRARTLRGLIPGSEPARTLAPSSAVPGSAVFNSRLRHREMTGPPAWTAEPIPAGSLVTPGCAAPPSFTNATYRVGSGHNPGDGEKGCAEHVRAVYRPVAAGCCPGARRGQDARSRLHRHRAHPARADPRGRWPRGQGAGVAG